MVNWEKKQTWNMNRCGDYDFPAPSPMTEGFEFIPLYEHGWCLHKAEKRTADYWGTIQLHEWQLNPKRCPDRDYCTQTFWRTKLKRFQLFPACRHMPLTSTRRDRRLAQSNLPALLPWLRSLASDQRLITQVIHVRGGFKKSVDCLHKIKS